MAHVLTVSYEYLDGGGNLIWASAASVDGFYSPFGRISPKQPLIALTSKLSWV